MLKLRSTVHEVAWQFKNLPYSSGLMFSRVILQLLLGHYSFQIGHQREQNSTEIILKHVFKSHFYILRNT